MNIPLPLSMVKLRYSLVFNDGLFILMKCIKRSIIGVYNGKR